MTSGDEGPLMCGNIDWVDKRFLLRRIAAAAIVLFGFSALVWSVFLMRSDKYHATSA
jgi:hypothetical protein